MIQGLCRFILKLWGWKVMAGEMPDKKAIIIGAPHTSIWDYVISWLYYTSVGGTAHTVIKKEMFRLNAEFTQALAAPDIRERLARMGAEPSPMSPEAFASFVRAEQAKYERVVKSSGARVE